MADEAAKITAALMMGEASIPENNENQTAASSLPPVNDVGGAAPHSMDDVEKNGDAMIISNNQNGMEASAAPSAVENCADVAAAADHTAAAANDVNNITGDDVNNITCEQQTPTTTTTNNEPNNDTSAAAAATETPLSTPRRRIKKRREDGFVYAEDTKAEKSSTQNKKQQPQREEEPSSNNEELKQEQCKKRLRKCPARDSILIDVPLSVTGDLKIAMRRTRRKRVKRIKEWVASGIAAAAAASCSVNGKQSPNDNGNVEKNSKDGGSSGGEEDEKKAPSALEEYYNDELEDGGDGPQKQKNQYGSIVDYLEAKYVRGVMIDDYDERERVKTKKIKKRSKSGDEKKVGEEEEEDDSDDSDGKGSCYESDGWIDDTLLHEEVAGQVMASNTYGMTQIEEKARKRKEDNKRKQREKGVQNDNGDDQEKKKMLEGAAAADGLLPDENDKSDGEHSKEDYEEGCGVDSDFDDGFFVNLGDLEMAEGWKGEHDMVISPAKKKKKAKKKRAYNKKSPTKKISDKSATTTKAKSKTIKKKNVNAKAAAPGAKKKLSKKVKADGKAGTKNKTKAADSKVGSKNKKAVDGKAGTKKKKAADDGDGKTTAKRKKAEGGKDKNKSNDKSKKSDDASSTMSKKKKKKGTTASVSVLESATSPEEPSSKEASAASAAAAGKKESNNAKSVSPKEKKKKPEMSKEKEKATQLRKLFKRRYNACIKQLKEMSSEELPKKQKNKGMKKVSVNIPADKSIGDEITFENPNVPGQKLKVKIPKKADMEKRNFVVSVPVPKVKEPEIRENNFPKEFKEALYNYASAYDDWCVAEGEHNDSLPAAKRKQFKLTSEKNKKFDDMIEELPKNLATPIDASYLRKIVRQERSNKTRREKRKDGISSAGGAVGPAKQEETEINIPQKGTEFSSVVFDKQDFQGN
ncbi:hypothetical protein ACHAXR_008777 [Thalassiosira sp. AJA248-18]